MPHKGGVWNVAMVQANIKRLRLSSLGGTNWIHTSNFTSSWKVVCVCEHEFMQLCVLVCARVSINASM